MPNDVTDLVQWQIVALNKAQGEANTISSEILSEQERQRASRFIFERDRQRYVAAHVSLRTLLGARLKLAPAHLTFAIGPFGKPALTSAAVAFNLSHSEDRALIGIANEGDIGVDIEKNRPMRDAVALARANFHPLEQDELHAVKESERDAAFLSGWTRKEACLKALGSGLSISAASFYAGLSTHTQQVTISTPYGQAMIEVKSIDVGLDWFGAVAVVTAADAEVARQFNLRQATSSRESS